MRVTVNGQLTEVAAGATLEQVVEPVTSRRAGVAAAVDGVVVPRGQWASQPLADGAQVEIVVAVQGG